MTDLKPTLTTVLSTTLAFGIQAQYAHWNFMGSDFLMWHGPLGAMYDDAVDAADTIAEAMRTKTYVVPFAYPASVEVSTGKAALAAVATANKAVITALAAGIADTASAPDIQNMLQDRLAVHQKHAWMLRASGVGA